MQNAIPLAQPGNAAEGEIRFFVLGIKPTWLDQLREAPRARCYSGPTDQNHRSWVKRSILFHHVRRSAQMAEPEIKAFLTHLAVKERVSPSTQNKALSALLFLYRHVLGREIGDLGEVNQAIDPTLCYPSRNIFFAENR